MTDGANDPAGEPTETEDHASDDGAGTLIITDTLRIEHGRKGKQRLVSAALPPANHDKLSPADYRAAIRYHVLKRTASGEYESLPTPAQIHGVSKAWMTRLTMATNPA